MLCTTWASRPPIARPGTPPRLPVSESVGPLRMRSNALFSGAADRTRDNYAQDKENMMAGSCEHSEPNGKWALKSSLLKYGRVNSVFPTK